MRRLHDGQGWRPLQARRERERWRSSRRRRGQRRRARHRAKNGAAPRQERSSEQGHSTRVAAEAALGGVPVLTLVAHLALVDADRVATRVAELGKEAVEAAKAEGPTVPHDVPLAAQLLVALEARKMFHVPRAALGLGALVGQNNLRKVIFY